MCQKSLKISFFQGRLDTYKRQWNDKHGCWGSKPLHNAASHGSDAFRMLCVGLSQINRIGMTAEDLDKIHREAMGIPAHGGFLTPLAIQFLLDSKLGDFVCRRGNQFCQGLKSWVFVFQGMIEGRFRDLSSFP